MKKLITIIVLAIVGANTYGQYITPVGTAQWFKKNVYFGSDTANANAVIRTNGKVGIGTASPTETLTVNGSYASTYSNAGKKYLFISNSIAHGIAVQDSVTNTFESQLAVDPNFILVKNSIGINMDRAFFSIYDEDNLIIGFGNSSLNNKSNTIRFDSTSKFCVGIDASIYTPNMQWVDSSYTPKASIYNNGFMAMGTASAPQQTLDVAGNAKIDSSLILNGEFYTISDSVFTIPNAISTVIVDATHSFVNGTITMPSHPIGGQIISITTGENGYDAVTIAPNTGQTISRPVTSLHGNGGTVTYRYRAVNSTWYRW